MKGMLCQAEMLNLILKIMGSHWQCFSILERSLWQKCEKLTDKGRFRSKDIIGILSRNEVGLN